MQIFKATEFKAELENLSRQCALAENNEAHRQALKAVIAQLDFAKKNTYRFMTFPVDFYNRLGDLHSRLCRKYMWSVAGKELDLEHDLHYLAAKAQIHKIQKKFWFR